MQPHVTADRIVAFYSGAPDDSGRTLDQILSWTDDRLESIHDYVQWLFPLRQPSPINPFAPTVTSDTVRAFEKDGRLRDGLRRAYDRMLAFYGLRRLDGGRVGIDDSRFAARADVWLHPGNHNHLRLTRIIESLATLDLRDDAQALQRCLLDDVCTGARADRVTAKTVGFWRRAVQ